MCVFPVSLTQSAHQNSPHTMITKANIPREAAAIPAARSALWHTGETLVQEAQQRTAHIHGVALGQQQLLLAAWPSSGLAVPTGQDCITVQGLRRADWAAGMDRGGGGWDPFRQEGHSLWLKAWKPTGSCVRHLRACTLLSKRNPPLINQRMMTPA